MLLLRKSDFETSLDKSGGKINLYYESQNLRHIWIKVGENICLYYESRILKHLLLLIKSKFETNPHEVMQINPSMIYVDLRSRQAEGRTRIKNDF